jgi:hypothetical protein
MARVKPITTEQLGRIHGVGQAKLSQYGETFLELVRENSAQTSYPPPRDANAVAPSLASTPVMTAPLHELAAAVEEAVRASSSWEELQERLLEHDLEYFERGGGVAIRVKSTGEYVAKGVGCRTDIFGADQAVPKPASWPCPYVVGEAHPERGDGA